MVGKYEPCVTRSCVRVRVIGAGKRGRFGREGNPVRGRSVYTERDDVWRCACCDDVSRKVDQLLQDRELLVTEGEITHRERERKGGRAQGVLGISSHNWTQQ
ncbi:hypothetical protein chiPu_0002625 [Chiloscyllium punctatum]|uniref:Uncharacterized protein n=1 Tax=Chiloscyllium punctatum TaxID=137246 RepID=A0A401S1F6_CHIPU|nr:hypothetical protein [Chiloscyllium punctatum]